MRTTVAPRMEPAGGRERENSGPLRDAAMQTATGSGAIVARRG